MNTIYDYGFRAREVADLNDYNVRGFSYIREATKNVPTTPNARYGIIMHALGIGDVSCDVLFVRNTNQIWLRWWGSWHNTITKDWVKVGT